MTYSSDHTKNPNNIGDDRARALTKVLGDAPDPADPNAVRRYLADLADAGLHVLFVHPATKVPADPRPTPEAIAADRAFREAVVRSGRPQSRVHLLKAPAGHNLASNETEVLNRYHDQYRTNYTRDYPEGDVPVNLGVKLGPSRLVVVDCDTADQVSAFLADAEAPADLSPTVASPGVRDDKGNWPHRDGGHFWFVVPEDVELPATIGTFTAAGGYAVMWGKRYVLIPPSTRKEGSYTAPGEVHVLPEWLREQIVARGRDLRDRAERCGAGEGSTSITAWSQSQTWAEILGPSWTPTGRADSCGCETWTAPGEHGSPKSATAHEIGCTIAQHDPDNPPLHFWTTGDRGQFSDWPHDNISKLQAVALSEYDNDMGDAMTALDLFDDGETVMLDDRAESPGTNHTKRRRLEITWAKEIEPEPVVWLWADITARNVASPHAQPDSVDPHTVEDIACVAPGHSWHAPEVETDGRLACGMVSIAAGREGSGKSSFGIWLAAKITRGLLPGAYYGQPRRVFYLATEDSWQHTLVPRLIAAGADLAMVARIKVVERETSSATLCLPEDVGLLTEAITDHEVALVVVDPLMSMIGGSLDANASKDVRRALEPLAEMAFNTGVAVVAIAHFNKATGLDALSRITGSGAFKDVARAVVVFADDGDERVFTQPKNSVGRNDLPSLTYRIGQAVVETPKGKTSAGVFSFTGWADRSVDEVLADTRKRTHQSPAMKFIIEFIAEHADDSGEVELVDVVEAGKRAGFSRKQLTNARSRCTEPTINTRSEGFGKDKRTYWSLDGDAPDNDRPGDQAVPPKKINPFPGPSHGTARVDEAAN